MARSKKLFKGALGAVAALALLAAAEAAVRRAYPDGGFVVIDVPPESTGVLKLSPELQFEPCPPRFPLDPAPPFWSEINSRGFRDLDWSEKKGRRVLLLGDWGPSPADVPFGSTYPRLLEKKLDRAAVYNATVEGYNTCHQAALLKERLADVRFDTLLLAYSLNDRTVYTRIEERGLGWTAYRRHAARPYFIEGSLNDRLLEWSALYEWLNWRAAGAVGRRGDGDLIRFRERGGDVALACFDEMAAEAARRGAAFRVAVFPALFSEREMPAALRHEKEALLARARERGTRVLDVADALSRAGGPDLSVWRRGPRDHAHLNAAGNAVAAEALARFLTNE